MHIRTTAILLLLAFPALIQAAPDAKSFGALPDRDAAISPDATQIALIMIAKGGFAIRVVHIDNVGEPVS